MNLGFRERGWPGGFVRAKRPGSRRMEMDGHGRLGQRRSPGGIGHKAEIPAQAQVVAWARGESARGWARGCAERADGPRLLGHFRWLRARAWAGRGPRVCWLGRNGQMNRYCHSFCFLIFQKTV